MKRTITFLMVTTLFLSFAYGQKYKAGNSIPQDPLLVTTLKRSLPVGGDKLINVLYDENQENPSVTVNVYNSDFSLFRTFTTQFNDNESLVYMHNGVDLIENGAGSEPAYFLLLNRYTYVPEEEMYGGKMIILNEQNEKKESVPVSWMGHQTFQINGQGKVAGAIQDWDTVYWSNEGGSGWLTYQVHTSVIGDVATGATEHTFPRGTTFNGIYTIDGQKRILTQNNNFEMYQYDKLYLNPEMYVLNLDYSLYKLYTAPASVTSAIAGIPKEDIFYTGFFFPLFGQKGNYFYHFFRYYTRNTAGEVTGNADKSYLTDLSGNVVFQSNNFYNMAYAPFSHAPIKAEYLPALQKDIFFTYDSIYSFPDMAPLSAYNYFLKDDKGNPKIVIVKNDEGKVNILKDDLTPYKTVPFPAGGGWNLLHVGYDDIVKDDKIEVVFSKESNLLIVNEDNNKVAELTDADFLMGFMSYTPTTLYVGNEKYARLISDQLVNYYRVGNIPVQVSLSGQNTGAEVQLLRKNEAGEIEIAATQTTTTAPKNFETGEGRYYIRALGENKGLNTYYPSALLWQNATAIDFNTDNAASLYTLLMQPLPPAPPATAEGIIRGRITEVFIRSRFAGAQPASASLVYDLYLIDNKNQSTIAFVSSAADGTYEFEKVPAGSYDVLLSVPGKPMRSANRVILANDNSSVENADYEITDTEVIAKMNTATTDLAAMPLFLFPNPAKDFIYTTKPIENGEVRIFDVTGKTLHTGYITDSNSIDVSSFANGFYLIEITENGVVYKGKFLKK